MDEHDADLYRMLGSRTVAQFALLPPDERRAIFRQHLVQDRPTMIEEGDDAFDLNPDIASGFLLRQQHFMGDDEVGQQLVKEAREIYYGENQFNVRLHWLCEFMSDSLGDYKTKIPTAPLVRGAITVVANLHDPSDDYHPYGPDGDKGKDDKRDEHSVHYRHGTGKLARQTQKRLQDLFLFSNAKQVTLVLHGRGLLDGSDLATHQTMKDISFVVRRLIEHFGDRFTIKKRLDRGSYPTCSLRSYWDPPTDLARQNVRRGEATFEQLMQVEMEEWTRVLPQTIGPWMGREILA